MLPRFAMRSVISMGGAILACTLSHAAAPAPALPADAAYVTVSKDGHLSLNGKRVRYWGFIGSFITDWTWENKRMVATDTPEQRAAKVQKHYKDISAAGDRMKALGFNLFRCWQRPSDDAYTKGDGSANDLLAYTLAEYDKRGIKVWMSGINEAPVTAADVDIVKDSVTAKAWQDAVTEMSKGGEMNTWCRAVFWDARIEAIGIRAKLRRADFRNQYKQNMRLADDPQIVVWELSNEEWWLRAMQRGEWQKYPAFFQQSLIARWNGFLKQKYGSDEKLIKAWVGLMAGESLASGTIQFMPLLTNPGVVMPNDANPQVKALLSAAAKGTLTRDDFARQRGADIMEFLVKLQVKHKQAEYAALKKHGKSCKLSPIIFDCGEGYMTQSLYLHQNADAVSIATYMTGLNNDPTSETFPFWSGLTEPPRLAWNVPWAETQRVPNKPYFVYEIGYENPGKYRTEYPYRVAQLASTQDWDIVNWHTCTSDLFDSNDSTFFDRGMDYSVSWNNNPQGLTYRYDEVFNSALNGAAEIFKNSLVKPAPKPTTYIFGRKTLYDPDAMDYGVAYGRHGFTMLPTTYRYGTRMYCDTTRWEDSVAGPTLTRGVYEPNPYRPNENITNDWRKGFLMFDAPGTATFTGFFARYGGPVKFGNGVVLDSVVVNNPPTMPYPVGKDELYVSFSLSSTDGKPLAQTKRAILSLVSTSFNSGFKLDEKKIRNEYQWQANPGSTAKAGDAPVLVARAGAKITSSAITGMKYRMLNWRLKAIAEGTVTGGMLAVPADKPVFIVELTR